jgi:transcriptional regulator with XRE-family HTH domain
MSTLRNLRERKGLTVSQLAAKASIPSRVITEYEEGHITMTLAHAKILAKALWVGIEDIMPRAGTTVAPSSLSQSPGYSPSQPTAPRPSPPPPTIPVAQAPAPDSASAHTGQLDGHAHNADPLPQPVAVQRPPRTGGAGAGSHTRSGNGKEAGATRGNPKPPSPPSAISDGQLQELERLAFKLGIDIAQLEERLGKRLPDLTRPEAKDWIKRVRAMAEEIAPGKKGYGPWPGGQIDQEAQYLAAQKEAGAHFTFKLFDGEQVSGVITDFTPYTITISTDGMGDDLVLRKLAVAYYKRTATPASDDTPAPAQKRTRQPKAKPETQAPLPVPVPQSDIDSDRVGEPVIPEGDNMDEDRGV